MCGCGEQVNMDWTGEWNRFVFGHQRRNETFHARQKEQQPLCGCGCGELTIWDDAGKRWNRYLHDHSFRGDSFLEKQVLVASQPKEAPLCRCGCGESVVMTRDIWNEYIHGHHAWQGGTSAEPYCFDWNSPEFKNMIRKRDGYKCQNPTCWNKYNKRTLHVHHINYVKKNCELLNLISLCCSCNGRANANRKYWQVFYEDIMQYRFMLDGFTLRFKEVM